MGATNRPANYCDHKFSRQQLTLCLQNQFVAANEPTRSRNTKPATSIAVRIAERNCSIKLLSSDYPKIVDSCNGTAETSCSKQNAIKRINDEYGN